MTSDKSAFDELAIVVGKTVLTLALIYIFSQLLSWFRGEEVGEEAT